MPSQPKRIDNSLAVAEAALEELLKRHESERAMVELEMQLDLRDKFYSLVAHDLRTPLTIAMLSAQMMEEKIEDKDAVQRLSRRILLSVRRADRMISDLLEANRLRAGHSILIQAQSCDLAKVAAKCVEDMGPIHRARCQFTGPASVKGVFDAVAIQRALENLITNAVKYGSESGPIFVTVVSEKKNVRLSVANEGPVLGREELRALFQWHARGKGHAKAGKIGWGLGLMLVQGIAEAHGGKVEVQSAHDTGTVFSLILPLKKES